MTVRLLAAAAALALPALAVLPVPPAASAGAIIDVVPSRGAAFSPNGDGRKDTAPVRFELTERAHVTVRNPRVGPIDLGTRGPGVHVWRWDGRGAANGGYRLTLVARTPDGRTDRDVKYVEINRGQWLDAVRIHTTRTTVHPRTPGKQDRIYVRSTKQGNATVVTLRDADGDVVLPATKFRQWWSWDGGGLAAGEYDATYSLHDRYGNERDIHRTLRVSDVPLVQRTWTGTFDAADLERDDQCGTSPSSRYENGVTVAPGPGCERASLVPRFPLPVDADPDVTWRLTVVGSGDPAQVFIADDLDVVATTTPAGDGTTTTPWGSPHAYEWDPDREPEPSGWVVVDQAGSSYDVAELTLEVRYWTTSAAAAPTAARASAPRTPGPRAATAPSR